MKRKVKKTYQITSRVTVEHIETVRASNAREAKKIANERWHWRLIVSDKYNNLFPINYPRAVGVREHPE